MRRKLKVGDRVKYHELTGTIKKIEGWETWTLWDNPSYGLCHDTGLYERFVIIESKKIEPYGIVKFLESIEKRK